MKCRLLIAFSLFCAGCLPAQVGVNVDYTTNNGTTQASTGGYVIDMRPNINDIVVDQTNGLDSNVGNFLYPFATLRKAVTTAVSGSVVRVRSGLYVEYVTNIAPFVTYYADQPVISSGFLIQTNNVLIDGKNQWIMTGTNAPTGSGATVYCKEGSLNVTLKNFACWSKLQPYGTLAGAPTAIATTCATNHYYATSNIWIENIVLTNQGYIAVGLIGDHVTMTNCFLSSTNGFDGIQMSLINSDIVGITFSNFDNPGLNTVHCDLIQGFTDNGYYCTNVTIRQCFGFDSQHDTKLGNWSDASNSRMNDIWFINNIWANIVGLRDISAPGVHSINETFFFCGQSGANPLSYSVVNDATHGDSRNCKIFNTIMYGCGLNPGTNGFNANGWYNIPTNGQPGTVSGNSLGGNFADYNWAVGYSNLTKRTYPSSATGWGYTNDVGKTEAHGINGNDPHFNNSLNYSNTWPGIQITSASLLGLKSGSLGIGAGTNLTSLNVRGMNIDFFGNPRPATNWTIGAIEPQ